MKVNLRWKVLSSHFPLCCVVMALFADRHDPHCCHCLGPLLNVNFPVDKGLCSVLMIHSSFSLPYDQNTVQQTFSQQRL